MKNFYFLFLFLTGIIARPATAQNQDNKRVASPVILDTDISPDYDDVGALAILHALADLGEAKILATISCNAFETTGPTLSVFNTYFNRSDIPIGAVKHPLP